MSAQKGALLLLKVGNGGAPESFSTVGGLRTTRLVINQQPVDATHKESGQWRALLAGAGLRSVTVAGTGVFTDAASEELVRGYAFAGTIQNYRLTFGNGDQIQGAFQIVTYERAGDHDAEETYALTLESAGPVTFTAG